MVTQLILMTMTQLWKSDPIGIDDEGDDDDGVIVEPVTIDDDSDGIDGIGIGIDEGC